ncbi:MAG TPA: YbaB/EbfC family nucleoid-associated protein [Thermomicrobiales bacterium]|nr:YbaB/EbfC family nucleoid-associated protein [Thermomicrobiales bacterium]
MRMIQQMQNRIAKIQDELGATIVEGTAGGGMVTAQVTGLKAVHGIKIQPEAIDPNDAEMLEDLVVAAINDAMANAEALASDKMSAITGGLSIPGLT